MKGYSSRGFMLGLSLALFSASPLVAATPAAGLGTLVDTKAFFDSVKGNYKIQQVGGEAPHGGNDVATVEYDSGQYVFTFPYCPPGGGCDPGYIFFDVAPTKVYLAQSAAGRVYTILTTDGGARTKYSWQVAGANISFRNYQYRLPSGRVVTLEHVLTRVSD